MLKQKMLLVVFTQFGVFVLGKDLQRTIAIKTFYILHDATLRAERWCLNFCVEDCLLRQDLVEGNITLNIQELNINLYYVFRFHCILYYSTKTKRFPI